MEQFEFILVVLVCVGLSSVIDHLVDRVSLPLLQVGVGLVAAIAIPGISGVEMESELFLVLFIAPLLFNETREASPRQLWQNRGSILSLAVGLVVVSVLAVGFVLHGLVPSLPLAAAFALGGALGPTDAATVAALKSSVNLSRRQTILLSGESLINDASGVVAFQFAVAAAVTGTFSLADATTTFLVLFVGGVAVGTLLGFVLSRFLLLLRRLGLEDVTSHALYELLSPFVVYLVAETLHVSGILAVVAAGLVMAASRPHFHSTFDARRALVSNSIWSVIAYLINGTLFVLLGMQLPHVVMPGLSGGLGTAQIVGIICALAVTSVVCRLVWVYVLELVNHRRGQGWGSGTAFHDALVTTIAGAKGAVTLSIVLTLPATVASGTSFPGRSLLVTLAAGVILLTLMLADLLLPRLAPQPVDDGARERELHDATVAVFEGTAAELRRLLDDPLSADYAPALRLTLSRYQMRLAVEQLSEGYVSQANRDVEAEEFRRQAERLEELHQLHLRSRTERDWQEHLGTLRSIRKSVGYQGRMEQVVSRRRVALDAARVALRYVAGSHHDADDVTYEEAFTRRYGQACIYAIELEYVSIDYFDEVICGGDKAHAQAAKIRKETHEISLKSLWDRLNYGRDIPLNSSEAYSLPYDPFTHEFTPRFREQFAKAREYGRDVDENALRIELDVIARLQTEGTVSRDVANELRGDVHLLQMSLE